MKTAKVTFYGCPARTGKTIFLPIHDNNGLKYIRHAYVMHGLIAVNVVIWLFMQREPEAARDALQTALGFIPSIIFGNDHITPSIALVPPTLTFLTYAFLHINFLHVATNMLFLWVFGDNVEDAMGHARFLIFYLACAIFGAFTHGLTNIGSQLPMIGASGAISGILAAYILLHPRVRVWMLVLFDLPVIVPLAFWMAEQFYNLATNRGGDVSWRAHAGGIIASTSLIAFMKRKEAPLWDRYR